MTDSDDTRGALYIATGDEFVREAKVSAESLTAHNDLHVTLYTDRESDYKVFDNVQILESPRHDQGDSIPNFDQLPYDQTLLLDSDTYICSNVHGIFEALDQFDIGAAFNVEHEVDYADLKKDANANFEKVPDSFYELNTGVVAFKKSTMMREFLQKWNYLYDLQLDFTRNQPSFRHALYNSDLRVTVFPREYNYRLPKLATAHKPIKIIHGRHPCPFDELEIVLNKFDRTRVITKTNWPIGVITEYDMSYWYRFKYNIEVNGFVGTMKKIRRKIETSMK